MFRAIKAKKGLWNAVTALIVVIASVIVALVVVGFAFGLFGAIGGTPTVTQVGTGVIYVSNGQAVITLHSTGNVQVVSAMIAGTPYTGYPIAGATLTAGINTVTLSFSGAKLQPGTTYQISIALSDGQTVQVAVIAQ